ncbi:MAG: phage tail protein [Lysobacter sp.]
MSGQQIGTVVGGVIGFYFGGPAGAQLGMAIGGAVGGAIDPEVIKAPGIGDAQRQTTQAGVPRAVVYGHPAPFMGNIIDGEAKARKIIVEEGGKGGPVVESERFLLTSAIRICEGPIAGIVRIWRNGEVVYDVRTYEEVKDYDPGEYDNIFEWLAEMRARSLQFKNRARFYLGTEDQLPDAALEAIHGVGNTPYYRGTAYIVVEDDDVTDTRGACAQYQFEVVAAGSEASVSEIVSTSIETVTGGSFGSGAYTGSLQYSTGGGTFPIDSPFVFLSSSQLAIAGNHIRAKFETLQGELLWDSGWHSDAPDPGALAEALNDAGLGDELGPVRLSNGRVMSPMYAGIAAETDFIATYYAAFTGTEATQSNAMLQTCNPQDMPQAWKTSPELPGALIGSDGKLYFPDWMSPQELKAITTDSVTLASVVEDIAGRCNVPADRIDVSALTDIIPGFLVSGQYTGADCIRPTQQMYFYDMPEVDGQIVAVLRGGSSIGTITEADMLESGDDDDDIRAQPVEFPLKVSVMTRDPAADYSPVPQTSARYSAGVKAAGEVMITSPIPFGADEAMQRAVIIHRVLWAQAEGRSEFQLPEEWTRLVPSDCFDRNGKRWMIGSGDYADGAVSLKANYDRAGNYTSNATGQPAPPPTVPGTGLKGPTLLAAMNLPALREQDNVPGAYLAATGVFPAWNGCTVQMSIDGGATYRTVATIGRRSAMGRLTDTIGPTTEPIPVALDDGALSDSTIDYLDMGANAFALVPTTGQSEIGQFTTATEGDPDQYAITGTRRGVNGSDATSHASGQRFVMLTSPLFLPIDSELYGTLLYFRAITSGTVAEDNDAIPFLFLEPPPPPDYRITEAGDYRITEAGNRRTLE